MKGFVTHHCASWHTAGNGLHPGRVGGRVGKGGGIREFVSGIDGDKKGPQWRLNKKVRVIDGHIFIGAKGN